MRHSPLFPLADSQIWLVPSRELQVVLVRALHQLTAEMAKARAEARQYAAVSERSLSTAWRLGQLGQLGLALLEGDGGGDEAEGPAPPPLAAPEALDAGGPEYVDLHDPSLMSPPLTDAYLTLGDDAR